MKLFKLISITLILFVNILNAQINSQFYDSWIKTKMESIDNNFSINVAKRDSQYLKYTFKTNETVYFTLKYNDLGFKAKYTLENKIINLGFNKLKIESINDTSLVLIELDNGAITEKSVRIFFTKESVIQNRIPIKPNDYFIKNKDTIYFESPKVYPIFYNKEDPDLKAVIQRKVEGLSNGKESFAFATFILTTDGKISDIQLHHHINKSYDKNLINAIIKTEGFWVSPNINGVKVNVLKEISFAYVGFPDIKNENGGLIMNFKNSIYPEKYRIQFVNCIKLMYLGQSEKSLEELNNCSNLTQNPSNIYYQKIICYKKFNDVTNRNIFIEKLKKTNFKYLLNQ